MVAKEIHDTMNIQSDTNAHIISLFNQMTDNIGGDGGAIAINAKGEVGFGWNSRRMAWAYVRGSEVPFFTI